MILKYSLTFFITTGKDFYDPKTHNQISYKIGPPYLWVQHLWIQPTGHQEIQKNKVMLLLRQLGLR